MQDVHDWTCSCSTLNPGLCSTVQSCEHHQPLQSIMSLFFLSLFFPLSGMLPLLAWWTLSSVWKMSALLWVLPARTPIPSSSTYPRYNWFFFFLVVSIFFKLIFSTWNTPAHYSLKILSNDFDGKCMLLSSLHFLHSERCLICGNRIHEWTNKNTLSMTEKASNVAMSLPDLF